MICKYWHKGKEILLEGKLSTREYQDKNGNDRSVTEMTVDRVHFCGKNEDAHGMPPRTGGQFVEVDEDFDTDGDMPF
jgi:single-strand DNA-binding protein